MSDFFAQIAVFGSVFGSLFGIAYLYFTTRNRERMAMIEKGIGAELFSTTPKPKFTFWALKIGLLIFGIGLGLILVIFYQHLNYQSYQQKMTAYWAYSMTFGGLGLIISFIIESIMTKKQK